MMSKIMRKIMDTNEEILEELDKFKDTLDKKQQVNKLEDLSSIASSLDDMEAEFRKTNILVGLSDITNAIDNLATQTFELNKKMEGIAGSLSSIALNARII